MCSNHCIAEGSQNSCAGIAYPLGHPQFQEVHHGEGHGCSTGLCNRSINQSPIALLFKINFLITKEQPEGYIDLKNIKSHNDTKLNVQDNV